MLEPVVIKDQYFGTFEDLQKLTNAQRVLASIAAASGSARATYYEKNADGYVAQNQIVLRSGELPPNTNDDLPNAIAKIPESYSDGAGNYLALPVATSGKEPKGYILLEKHIPSMPDGITDISFGGGQPAIANYLAQNFAPLFEPPDQAQAALLLERMKDPEHQIVLLEKMGECMSQHFGHSSEMWRHAIRVAKLTDLFLDELEKQSTIKFSSTQRELMHLGALTHDIGKMHFPPSQTEFVNIMQVKKFTHMHGLFSYLILRLPGMENIAKAAGFHHQTPFALGEPFSCNGSTENTNELAIPREAHMLAVMDEFEARTGERTWPTGMTLGQKSAKDSLEDMRKLAEKNGISKDILNLFIRLGVAEKYYDSYKKEGAHFELGDVQKLADRVGIINTDATWQRVHGETAILQSQKLEMT